MNKIRLLQVLIRICIFICFIPVTFSCKKNIKQYVNIDREPNIFPDYSNIVLPHNIAPLNFIIKEKEGIDYFVNIHSDKGNQIQISSSSPNIIIDENDWHKLLEANKGNNLKLDIYIKKANNNWGKYKTISNKIAEEKIDNHLVYRLINAGYVLWTKMGIYQRNLENFDESPILINNSLNDACVNCHSFANNDPNFMMMHIRKLHPGTIVYCNGDLKKINTKTKYSMSAGVYPSWHPSGKYIAYSVNLIGQNFTSINSRNIEVSDLASDIVVYDVKKNLVTTSPKVSTSSRENLPTWSPDGKMLYFVSAPEANSFDTRVYTRYSLLRIPYDPQTNTWGDIDTVLSANETGQSISFPKISPDGKFLIFCMSDAGYFTIHHTNSDLYIMNLQTKEYKKLDINSNKTDSYHCWASSGRWLVFSSKRLDGLYSRPFFCYIDENGKTSKPFVMPQEDPTFYDSFLKNYNIPELITGKVPVSANELRDIALSDAQQADFDKSVKIDALSGATWINK